MFVENQAAVRFRLPPKWPVDLRFEPVASTQNRLRRLAFKIRLCGFVLRYLFDEIRKFFSYVTPIHKPCFRHVCEKQLPKLTHASDTCLLVHGPTGLDSFASCYWGNIAGDILGQYELKFPEKSCKVLFPRCRVPYWRNRSSFYVKYERQQSAITMFPDGAGTQ